jgi:hypothetical protein
MIKAGTVEVVHTGFRSGLPQRATAGVSEPAIPSIADLEPAARWACEQRGENPDGATRYHLQTMWQEEAYNLHHLAISLAALKRERAIRSAYLESVAVEGSEVLCGGRRGVTQFYWTERMLCGVDFGDGTGTVVLVDVEDMEPA